jgi:hypothetical protein
LSILFALAKLTGADPIAFARYLNVMIMGVITVISGFWILQRTRSSLLTLAAGGLIGFGMPIHSIFVMVWSEPLFVLLALVFVVQSQILLTEPSWPRLILLAVVIGAACLTRYIGISLIITAVIMLALNRRINLKRRFFAAMLLTTLSFLPVAAWLLRNYVRTGTLTGQRPRYTHGYGWLLTKTGRKLLEWVHHVPVTNEILGAVFFLGLFSGGGAFIIILFSRYAKRREDPTLLPMLSCAFFIAVYITFLLACSAYRSITDGHRFLSPTYIPLVLLIVFAAAGVLRKSAQQPSDSRVTGLRILSHMVLPLLLIWTTYCAASTSILIWKDRSDGYGAYSKLKWINSPTIAYVQQMPATSPLVTNAPDVVWFLCNHRACVKMPRKVSPTDALQHLQVLLSQTDSATLVWFQAISTERNLFTPDELRDYVRVQTIHIFPDGIVYRLEALPMP